MQVLSWLTLDLVTTTDQIKLVSNMMHIPIKNSLIFKEDHGTVLKLFKSDSSNQPLQKNLIHSIEARESKDGSPFVYDEEREMIFYGTSQGVVAIDYE